MPKISYDRIIVTGDSMSCGTEMNDHLLGSYDTEKERDVMIWRWGKENFDIKGLGAYQLKEKITKKWTELEKKHSWPCLLEIKTGIPVVNLSSVASSVGQSLVSYSDYLRANVGGRTLAVHQIPKIGRMYMRLDQTGARILLGPGNMGDYGFHKKYYKSQINRVEQRYKELVLKKNFIETQYKKIIKRLDMLSMKFKIDNYFIVDSMDYVPIDKSKILISDFKSYRQKYATGKCGHPTGIDYNLELCEIVKSIL